MRHAGDVCFSQVYRDRDGHGMRLNLPFHLFCSSFMHKYMHNAAWIVAMVKTPLLG